MDNYRIFGILFVWIASSSCILSQSDVSDQTQNPIGAFRVFKKTSFSCTGRPAGYYADIETGCQVYHMCDGLGRQFSYSCPNTTLFQQRMLICDHWYMVNCSRAESHYDANLLIGQRDKPFVGDDENHLRTPRPDLLDRPYAPDYSGESFRNQYKQFLPIHNDISEPHHEINFIKPVPTRWRIQRPNPLIQPPSAPNTIRRSDEELEENSSIDLGTSFSSNYNTSADITAEQSSTSTTTTTLRTTTTTTTTTTEKSPESNVIIPTIKVPSRLYEPPFLYPIYNENYTATEEDETTFSPATTPTEATTPTTTTTFATSPTTTQYFNRRPSTFAGRPFTPVFITTTGAPETVQPESTERRTVYQTSTTRRPTTHKDYDFSRYITRQGTEQSSLTPAFTDSTTENNYFSAVTSTTTSSSPSSPEIIDDNEGSIFDIKVPTGDRLSLPSPFTLKADPAVVGIPTPSKQILPPFPEFIIHDIATTQGPPIYYEWKTPSDALEPPKFDPPIGVEGRTEEDYYRELDSISTASSTGDTSTTNQPRPFSHNPFLSPIVNKSQRSVTGSSRTPTPRSIQDTSAPQINHSLAGDTKDVKDPSTSTAGDTSPEVNIQQLKRDLSIPDFLFPLENHGRTGYEHLDTLNSFQLKIPERRSDDGKRWYGENPNCPECHPTFVKPGTCEPCVKRR